MYMYVVLLIVIRFKIYNVCPRVVLHFYWKCCAPV